MKEKESKNQRSFNQLQSDTLNYYNTKAQEFVDGTVDVNFTDTQDMFLSYLPTGSKILDFGCGSGRDSKYFLDKGYLVDAIDGSEELCKRATEYTKIPVKHMLFEELNENEIYDGVWACASILHVEREKLPRLFGKITHATKTNAIVYVSFKYGDFEGVRNGRYFTYLTKETFVDILKQGQTQNSKLVVEKMWISGDVRDDRGGEQWLNVILRKKGIC